MSKMTQEDADIKEAIVLCGINFLGKSNLVKVIELVKSEHENTDLTPPLLN